jgi:hypothetical protein
MMNFGHERPYANAENFLEPAHRWPGSPAIAHVLIGASLASGIGGIVDARSQQQVTGLEQRVDGDQVTIDRLQKELNRATTIAEGATGLPEGSVQGQWLDDVSEIPVTNREPVSAENRERLRAATVKIIKHSRDSEEWIGNCSATMVSYEQETYVVTARHCMSPQGGKGGGKGAVPDAIDITSHDEFIYAVVPPDQGSDPAGAAPVEQISVTTVGDWALMKVNFDGSSVDPANAIPANDYINQRPDPGLNTVEFSMPQAANGGVVAGDGVYLGSIKDPSDTSRYIDLVGLTNAETPAEDACNYGGSGSAAMLSNGRLLGPLSVRNNISYAPGAPDNPPDNRQSAGINRWQFEASLNLNMSEFTTVCGYSSADSSTIPKLVSGFGTFLN